MASAPNAACSASFLSQVVSGNVIVCNSAFQDFEESSATDQIQSVVDNAVSNYGENSAAAQTAQTFAEQQEAQISDDVQSVTESVASSNVDQIFTQCDDGNSGLAIPGLPCIDWTYIGIGIAALILLYIVALFSSIIPRGR